MDRDTQGEQVEIDEFLESTLESVDRAEELVVDAAKKAGIEEDDALSLGMAVRECAVNAVVHGNRYNLNKKVHLTIARSPAQLIIRIADEGEGFELSELPDPLAEENLLRHSGRGIFIIRAFTDDFDAAAESRGDASDAAQERSGELERAVTVISVSYIRTIVEDLNESEVDESAGWRRYRGGCGRPHHAGRRI